MRYWPQPQAIPIAAAIVVAGYDVLVRINGAIAASIRESAAASGGGSDARELQQINQMITVDASIGFWLTIVALIAAIVMLKMVHGKTT
jgi:hypothetical protein